MPQLAAQMNSSDEMHQQISRNSIGENLHARLATRLQSSSDQLMMEFNDDLIKRVIAYSELLMEWNKTFNLTAVRTLEGIVDKHFLDCFAINHLVQGNRIIDIGSGAGFPGIPVALVRPDAQVVLLDSKGKKVQFLRHAVASLKITNVKVVHDRIQNVRHELNYDTALVRGLGSLSAIAEFALPVISRDGRIVAMKGKLPNKEISAIRTPCQVDVRQIFVPGLDIERHCVILKHSS